MSYGLVGRNDSNGERITRIGRLSSTQKFFTDWCIPDLLVNVVTTDHCFNLEGTYRHCFSTSHRLQLVDEHAKSASDYYRYHVYALTRNSLIVGMAYWAAHSRNYFDKILKNSYSWKFWPAKYNRYTVYGAVETKFIYSSVFVCSLCKSTF